MKQSDILKLSAEELQSKLHELRGELQKLRFDIGTMKETKVHTVSALKKNIARILTRIHELTKQS